MKVQLLKHISLRPHSTISELSPVDLVVVEQHAQNM